MFENRQIFKAESKNGCSIRAISAICVGSCVCVIWKSALALVSAYHGSHRFENLQIFKAEIENESSLSEEQRAKSLQAKFTELQVLIDQKREGSRLWKLSNRSIYGTDANDRMARTSKMNMIMHGDGHGGSFQARPSTRSKRPQ